MVQLTTLVPMAEHETRNQNANGVDQKTTSVSIRGGFQLISFSGLAGPDQMVIDTTALFFFDSTGT